MTVQLDFERGDQEPFSVIVLEGCTIGMYINCTFVILK
jgi:hypothetical protein